MVTMWQMKQNTLLFHAPEHRTFVFPSLASYFDFSFLIVPFLQTTDLLKVGSSPTLGIWKKPHGISFAPEAQDESSWIWWHFLFFQMTDILIRGDKWSQWKLHFKVRISEQWFGMQRSWLWIAFITPRQHSKPLIHIVDNSFTGFSFCYLFINLLLYKNNGQFS